MIHKQAEPNREQDGKKVKNNQASRHPSEQDLIRASRVENVSYFNKRACAFIKDSRVIGNILRLEFGVKIFKKVKKIPPFDPI